MDWGAQLPFRVTAELGSIHTVLVLWSWRMQELWGHRGFQSDVKQWPWKPETLLLMHDNCICESEAEGAMETSESWRVPGTWTTCWEKSQAVSRVSPRESPMGCCWWGHRLRLPESCEAQISTQTVRGVEHRVAEINVALLGCGLSLLRFFFLALFPH